MFKTAVDIMLFKGLRQEDTELIDKKKEIESLELEKKQLSEEHSKQALQEREVARGMAEIACQIPSAEDARNKTLKKIRENAEVAIKKEATEILQKALQAIQYAISDEKFSVELGGPGRPDPGAIILRQAYAHYHEDARKVAVNKISEQGYKVEEIDQIFIRISW